MAVNLERKIKRTINKLAQQLRDIDNERKAFECRRRILISAITVNRKVLKAIYAQREKEQKHAAVLVA